MMTTHLNVTTHLNLTCHLKQASCLDWTCQRIQSSDLWWFEETPLDDEMSSDAACDEGLSDVKRPVAEQPEPVIAIMLEMLKSCDSVPHCRWPGTGRRGGYNPDKTRVPL